MTNPRTNLEVDETEYARCRTLIVTKARRYQLARVPISDRLVVSFSDTQLERLESELAALTPPITVDWTSQTSYPGEIAVIRSEGRRFGAEPRGQSARHPKGPDWAGRSR